MTIHLLRALLVYLITLPATGLAGSQPLQASDARPNILVLMAEDMSGKVAAFGNPVAVTPNLDKLAESGVRFPNTFTTAGVCAPSRAAQITGMYQVSIGAQHMRTRSFKTSPYRSVPPPDVKAYPELLRRNGYYTFTNNKLDYQFSDFGAGSGPFTIWDYEGNDPDWNRRALGQPFFGLINFGATHESQLFSRNVEKNLSKGRASVVDPRQVSVPPYYPDTPVVRKDIAQQYDNVHEMDRQVGEWLERLEADGLLENTIVIWTTDHGDGLPRAKREIYDSGIRVPLILRLPESSGLDAPAAGSVDNKLVSFVDFAPSILTWAGAGIPDFIQGIPTLAVGDETRQYVYAAKDRLDEMPFRERVVRDDRYKYFYNYMPGEPGATRLAYREQLDIMSELWARFEADSMNGQQAFWFKPRPREEFYDLEVDPFEVNNLVEDPEYAAELQRMRSALKEWQSRIEDYSDMPELKMALDFWPNGEQPQTAAPEIRIDKGLATLVCETRGASIGYRLDDGNWMVYSKPVAIPPGSTIRAKAVRYGWHESVVVEARAKVEGWRPVSLDDPDIHFLGMPYVDTQADLVRFSRFPPDMLELGKAKLGFNPDKARSTTGGIVAFQTNSPRIRLRLRPGAGMNRGSNFGVFIDGQFVNNIVFSKKQQNLLIEASNPSGAGSAYWEVTMPSFANPELVSLEIAAGSHLEAATDSARGVYVALGDSITHGTGQDNATHLTWPFLFARKLDYRLVNLAVGGSGVSVAAGESLKAFARVDLVTILIGYNDWNGEGDSVEAFRVQYEELLKAVRSSHPEVPVFCISPLVTRRDVSKTSGVAIEGFRSAVRQLIGQWQESDPNIHFIAGEDVSSLDNLKPDESNDPVHFSVAGAKLFADSLYSRIHDFSVTENAGLIELGNGLDIRAVIAPEKGGELSSLRVRRSGQWHELLYRALDYSKQAGWRGKAPLLWPATGITLSGPGGGNTYLVEEQSYPMPFHGFAKDRKWRRLEHRSAADCSAVVLQLSANGDSRKHYPFEFDLQVEYQLSADRLSIVYRISADASNPANMPFSIGNHLTFNAPLIAGSEAIDLNFENDLPEHLIRAPDKTFSGVIEPSPFRGLHSLAELPRREAISLSGPEGPSELTLYDASGVQLHISHAASEEPSEPFVRFNLWADASQGFFSPEPWLGLQNSLNAGAGLVSLPPGESWQWKIDISPSWGIGSLDSKLEDSS